jgi:hypothetical protein
LDTSKRKKNASLAVIKIITYWKKEELVGDVFFTNTILTAIA